MHEILLLATAIAALAAVLDWRRGRIPNALTMTVLVGAPCYHFLRVGLVDSFGRAALLEAVGSIVGALLAGFVPFLLFLKNGIGAGDVKLVAGIGAVLGPRVGIEATFYSFLAASLVGPAKLAYRGRLFRSIKTALIMAVRPRRGGDDVTTLVSDLSGRFALGPSVFVGTALAAWLHWRSV